MAIPVITQATTAAASGDKQSAIASFNESSGATTGFALLLAQQIPETTGIDQLPVLNASNLVAPQDNTNPATTTDLVATLAMLANKTPSPTASKVVPENGQENTVDRKDPETLLPPPQDAAANLGLSGLNSKPAINPDKSKDKESDRQVTEASSPDAANIVALPITINASNPARLEPVASSADSYGLGNTLQGNTAADTANLAASTAEEGSKTGQNFASMVASHGVSAPTDSSNTGVTQATRIDTPIHDHQWSQNLGDRVVWMAKNDQQSAQININPPQLGPVQINLHMNGDQATAVFTSPHAEVRQAIQDSMPQLRDMLSASGINLGQANVGSQSPDQQREFAAQQGNQNRYSSENAILSPDAQFVDSSPSQPIQRGRGLVDLFA